jgi:DNA repair protein RecN (Recombination protein N)
MLRFLKVSNLAIIDHVEVEFGDGFNVLTGETGAGKSILIGALDLLLGGRASPEAIRTGEDEAQVEGLFEIPDRSLLPADFPADIAGAGELILARKIFRTGKSRCTLNGALATLSTVQSVGHAMVSIFGQHEHRVLLDPEEHVEILDRFGGLHETRTHAAEAYAAWRQACRELDEAAKKLDHIEQQLRENAAAVKELAAASLREGEEEQLIQEREILKKASQIREKAYESFQKLYSRGSSIIGELSEIKKAVEYLASASPNLAKLRENFEEARYRLEDVALELRDVSDKYRSDPDRLEKIEDRLATIRRLKKKYGKDLPGLIGHLQALDQEAGDMLSARAGAKNLRGLTEQRRQEYLVVCKRLSVARGKAAKKLENAMKAELQELAMTAAALTVDFRQLDEDKGTANGLEKVEFFLASNPGEVARPLARVASGGELSRIMLALKALQVDETGAGTVIFDEVDTGVGGHTAVAVGTRLARVARRQQVLCVTHLHQIAALADHHFSVNKMVERGRTRIDVQPLKRDERVEELARMLGASPSSESAREHVRRLMDTRVAEVS